jgi:4-amino-4-deoxy-L-arabinose transferase-like glycosyltransferase
MPRSSARLDRFVWIVLVAALVLRIAVLAAFYVDEEPHGGDASYYMLAAQQSCRLWLPDNPAGAFTSVGPVYPLFLLPFLSLIPDSAPVAQMVAVRSGQVVLDTLTVVLVYLIARHLFGQRVARVALVAQALDARYIFMLGSVATETLFIALFAAFMLVYLRAAAQDGWGTYRLAGLILGVAVLTRPQPILFPALLAIHALLRPKERRRALGGVAWLTGVMILVIAPWTVRTALISGELVPIANSAFSHIWRSSREDGRELTGRAFAQAKAETLAYGEEDVHTEGGEYLSAGVENILAAPGQWIGRMAGDTLGAYLQPYGTVMLVPRSEVGARQVLADFLRGRASARDVLAIPGLWRRLLMYVWHFWGLLGGLVGVVLAWREHWRRFFPLAAWIVYATAVAAPLLIEARYVFVAMFAFTILAAYASVHLWDKLAPGLKARLQGGA